MNSEFKRVLLGLMISHIPKELKSEYQNSHTDSLQKERRPNARQRKSERKNGSRSPGPLRPEGTGNCKMHAFHDGRKSHIGRRSTLMILPSAWSHGTVQEYALPVYTKLAMRFKHCSCQGVYQCDLRIAGKDFFNICSALKYIALITSFISRTLLVKSTPWIIYAEW